ncbi:CoA transferase [Rhizobium sp. SG741]|uniref:CaiB/BaiF CoA transferase family protein n=1 Tax=Rhizobium sp. SG741 TaxID=2587114 RepID=UPI0014475D84|nr:CoA transferase [Rhizobium sp. SG741]NKJ08446.1 formyl-CoA transferase [Rhizobium sp. SG741]
MGNEAFNVASAGFALKKLEVPGTVGGVCLPLSGVRVIDFSQVVLGPVCTQMLGDFGAEVIKIEKELIGDLTRWSLGNDPEGGQNPIFSALNRNKKSVCADLKDPISREQVKSLIETADVVVTNFRPGVMERLGLGYEDLSIRNSRLIFAEATGYGPLGPFRHKGGQDILAQALSGLMARKPAPDAEISIYPTAICDYTAGMHLVQGILLALLHREKTGVGQKVSVDLYSSMVALQLQEATLQMMRGRDLNWATFPLTGVFQTKDTPIVVVGAFKEFPLRDICKALELEDLSLDPRFATFETQMAHREEIQGTLRRRFVDMTSREWLARLEAVDILCAPILTLPEALESEQMASTGMRMKLLRSDGSLLETIGTPVRLSDVPEIATKLPPRLGEHTDELLR